MTDLKWQKFPVLDDGFVCLVDCMGDDSSIVQAARVSYGKDARNSYEQWSQKLIEVYGDRPQTHEPSTPKEIYLRYTAQEQLVARNAVRDELLNDNNRLIRYLMRHRHTTPFEMAELKLLVRVPMDCWRQWIRHRTANVNEYSTRYSKAIDSQQKTKPHYWRHQSKTNKQGSEEGKLKWPDKMIEGFNDEYDTPEELLTIQEDVLQDLSRKVYESRLSAGVAREQARKDLPLSTYTEAYWKIDLHNLLNFLSLRMDSHAQFEIRQYAETIGHFIVKPLFPLVWEAFVDYRLESIHLTRLDIEMSQYLVNLTDGKPEWKDIEFQHLCETESIFIENGWNKTKCRERDECKFKLQELGIL